MPSSGYTKCEKCERIVPAGSRRCPGCGAPLRTADDGSGPTIPGGPLGPAILVVFLLLVFLYQRSTAPTPPEAPLPAMATATPLVSPTPVAAESVRFGLTETKRREVYEEILLAEDFVQTEADRRYPPLDENATSEDWQRLGENRERFIGQATAENGKAIAKKFGVTVDELRAITDEGVRAAWPRPARRSFR